MLLTLVVIDYFFFFLTSHNFVVFVLFVAVTALQLKFLQIKMFKVHTC